MRKHGSTPCRRDEYVTPAAIRHPGAARGPFVGGHQPGLVVKRYPEPHGQVTAYNRSPVH